MRGTVTDENEPSICKARHNFKREFVKIKEIYDFLNLLVNPQGVTALCLVRFVLVRVL